MLLKQFYTFAGVSAVALAAIGISGCAKQEFRKEQFTASAGAVGFRYLPPKVDILMVPDNTGSVNNMFSILQSSFTSFVSQLQTEYWDYHIGRSPVYYPSNTQSVGMPILVNGQFNSPYLSDGTPIPSTGLVPSDRAETSASNFPILQNVYQTGNGDHTYANTIAALHNAQSDTYTNFLRPDAMLAVVVVSNGYDSNITDAFGNYVGGGSSNLQSYANSLIGIKGSSQLVRFYAISSYAYRDGSASNYCLQPGGVGYSGNSYFSMNNYILGLPKFDSNGQPTSDVCSSSSLSNVLSDIAANLQIISQAYVYSNIVLSDEPVPSSIQVSKNGSALSESSTNGWEYKGFGTVYTITGIYDQSSGHITALSPGLNQRTGYVIQLNGSAQMVGSDTPDVQYEKK